MLEIEQVFIFTGVVLTLFFAVLLLTVKRLRSKANAYLAVSLLCISLIMLKINGVLEDTIIDMLFDFFRIEYLFAVLLYNYVSKVLEQSISKITHVLLWLPFLLFSGLYTLVAIEDGLSSEGVSPLLEIIEPFEIYLIIGFNSLVVLLFTRKVQNNNSSNSFKKWIYLISFGLICILLSFFIFEIIELFFNEYYGGYLHTAMALFFIILSYFGVQRLQVENERQQIHALQKKKQVTNQKTKSKSAQNHFERLKHHMIEKERFRDISLNRETIAAELGFSPSSLTRILKEEGQISFNDFVNYHRVAFAKKMLVDEAYDMFSLEAIGKESGFKSRSAFYKSFQKIEGVSPGVFKKDTTLS